MTRKLVLTAILVFSFWLNNVWGQPDTTNKEFDEKYKAWEVALARYQLLEKAREEFLKDAYQRELLKNIKPIVEGWENPRHPEHKEIFKEYFLQGKSLAELAKKYNRNDATIERTTHFPLFQMAHQLLDDQPKEVVDHFFALALNNFSPKRQKILELLYETPEKERLRGFYSEFTREHGITTPIIFPLERNLWVIMGKLYLQEEAEKKAESILPLGKKVEASKKLAQEKFDEYLTFTKDKLREALANPKIVLTSNERLALELRYGLQGEEDILLKEEVVGDTMMEISRQRVSQLAIAALSKIYEVLGWKLPMVSLHLNYPLTAPTDKFVAMDEAMKRRQSEQGQKRQQAISQDPEKKRLAVEKHTLSILEQVKDYFANSPQKEAVRALLDNRESLKTLTNEELRQLHNQFQQIYYRHLRIDSPERYNIIPEMVEFYRTTAIPNLVRDFRFPGRP